MRVSIVLLLALVFVPISVAQPLPIDVHRSSMTVLVSRSGMFSFLGDNHTIQAPVASGTLDEAGQTVTLQIDARQLKVLDPSLAADKRAEVQQRMLGPDVLDVDRNPQIAFRSTSASRHGQEVFVRGVLTLHGHQEPVEIRAVPENGGYRGSAAIRQTRFGMQPVKIAGGTVRVKDEVRIEFAIFPESPKQARVPGEDKVSQISRSGASGSGSH